MANKTQTTIKDLHNLLNVSIEEIEEYETKSLTAAGENYGSLMLALNVTIKIGDKKEIRKIVAKLPPPNEWLQKMFNTQVTFRREAIFYQQLIPILRDFQMEKGFKNVINIFPDCYGSRLNLLQNSDYVNDDAVLLLENLKLKGFTTANCMRGFDLASTKLIIENLAHFHAVPIALKIHKREFFEDKVLRHIRPFTAFESISDEITQCMINDLVDIVMEDKQVGHLAEKLKAVLQQNSDNYKTRASRTTFTEPLATLTHNDFWTNNIMIKEIDREVKDTKFIDFQLLEYGSPANDVLFFLFSSVQKTVIDESYDEILDLYCQTMNEILNKLNCEYTLARSLLDEEMEKEAKISQIMHVLVMMRPIYSLKDKVKDLSEMSEADMVTKDQLSDLYPVRICETVAAFASKGLL